jgi:hypothetical protein
MLQFGDLLAVKDGSLTDHWPVFHQAGWTVKTRPEELSGRLQATAFIAAQTQQSLGLTSNRGDKSSIRVR